MTLRFLNFTLMTNILATVYCLMISVSCTDEVKETEMLLVADPSQPTANVPPECLTQVACQGSLALYCIGRPNEVAVDCSEVGMCVPNRGCVRCEPNQRSCNGLQVVSCSADGLTETAVMTCENECYNGECTDPCARAVSERSYQGCEYWPTPISNQVNQEFTFAVGVVNVNSTPVNVSITRGTESIVQRQIGAGDLEVIELPWIDGLTHAGTINDLYEQGSSLVQGGAYQLITDAPVTVYQFSPLEYRLDGNCLQDDQDTSDNACFSYSNDASLLLPNHALDKDYLVLSYPSLALSYNGFGVVTSPSTFQVVAVNPGTTEVEIEFSIATAANHEGSIRSFQAGETTTLNLSQGEVLQFAAQPISQCRNPSPADSERSYCEVGSESDFSGTLVRADKPVQVFGSHTCAFIPYNIFACDHLEESIFPLSTWGTKAVVTKIEPLITEPSLVRVTSAVDRNRITFNPENVHPAVTLNQGEHVEFYTNDGFVVSGSGGLQVSQFLVGQNYTNQANFDGFGDPAMSLIPPADQFRTDYTILAPDTYALHYINIAMRSGSNVVLDGVPIGEGTPIGDSQWRELSLEIEGGVHKLEGSSPFGVWVYGFGNYTSYMYPGGLDLKVINDIEY